jgi:protein-S-isoprenylcysteine O-methyltransferase Ste14
MRIGRPQRERRRSMQDFPAGALTATIWAYWLCVGVMIVRVRRKTRKQPGVVPQQGLERVMWLVWVPLVVLWGALPYLAATRSVAPWAVPEFARASSWGPVRWTAVAVAVACLALSIECWLRMGSRWRMAVVPGERTELVTDGLYAWIRHPIYALSIILMIASAVIVPTGPMLGVAAIHLCLMVIKARNEEAFLREVHGETYARYCAQTGRFLPRLSRRATNPGREG